jgi:glucose/arabinose dehydrogenase
MDEKYSMHKNILTTIFLSFYICSSAQKGLPSKIPVEAKVNTSYPQHEDFKESMISRLTVAPSFKVSIAATGLGKPRMMATAPDGSLYVTRRDQGDVLLLMDTDNNGRFDQMKAVVAQFKGVHGIALKDSFAYLCSNRELKRYTISPDHTFTDTVMLFNDLPDGGQHPNRTMAFGPDGMLYLSVGSDCNDCSESNPEHATMLVIDLDSLTRKIYARGLRNTIGFDWNKQTGELWGMDNGTDWRGEEIPPEELNRIKKDGHYGWPLVYGKQVVDHTREEPLGSTKEAFAKTTLASTLEFPAHGAPINFKFLDRATAFPASYRQHALVTWHGSWNRKNPDGYKVQLIRFVNGQPVSAEDFLTGFLKKDGSSRFGRPAGIAVSSKGMVYISDDENGVIYSVSTK